MVGKRCALSLMTWYFAANLQKSFFCLVLSEQHSSAQVVSTNRLRPLDLTLGTLMCTTCCPIAYARCAMLLNKSVCGDDARTVPPVPIPNTAVKRPKANGTSLETTRECR